MADYANHPRFGNRPRRTGLDVDPDFGQVHLHVNTRYFSKRQRTIARQYKIELPEYENDGTGLIRGTAIPADLSKQTPATIPVTHYYDVEKICEDCKRRFIFFAEEQRYWYEELNFPLDADCVRCYECRRRKQNIERTKQRYDALMSVAQRTETEELELNLCRLELVEAGLFTSEQLTKVRAFLNKFPDHRDAPDLRARVEAASKAAGKRGV
ncbi:MAG: zinc-ribbon domain containing protein [Limisphaerales bacterium]